MHTNNPHNQEEAPVRQAVNREQVPTAATEPQAVRCPADFTFCFRCGSLFTGERCQVCGNRQCPTCGG
jgi:hypothetical protein